LDFRSANTMSIRRGTNKCRKDLENVFKESKRGKSFIFQERILLFLTSCGHETAPSTISVDNAVNNLSCAMHSPMNKCLMFKLPII